LAFLSGPAIGSALFIAGGFTLPYLVVASIAFFVAIILAIVVPNVSTEDKSNSKTESVNFMAIFTVRILRCTSKGIPF
jgi:hypothetical protein